MNTIKDFLINFRKKKESHISDSNRISIKLSNLRRIKGSRPDPHIRGESPVCAILRRLRAISEYPVAQISGDISKSAQMMMDEDFLMVESMVGLIWDHPILLEEIVGYGVESVEEEEILVREYAENLLLREKDGLTDEFEMELINYAREDMYEQYKVEEITDIPQVHIPKLEDRVVRGEIVEVELQDPASIKLENKILKMEGEEAYLQKDDIDLDFDNRLAFQYSTPEGKCGLIPNPISQIDLQPTYSYSFNPNRLSPTELWNEINKGLKDKKENKKEAKDSIISDNIDRSIDSINTKVKEFKEKGFPFRLRLE